MNDKQKQSVFSNCPSILVIAGPGTGKTKTLVARLEYLIKKGFDPSKILVLTFTKRAASEIIDRVNFENKPFIGTFHSLSLHLLNENPKIISKKEQLEIVSKKILQEISVFKNKREINENVNYYNSVLKDKGLVDYDDLLLMLLEKMEVSQLNTEFEHILIDEFQDTSPLQYEILKLLNSKNYFAIGDPNQSIYAFRGSSKNIFEDFAHDFPKHEIFVLDQNYRSTREIVEAFGSLFENKTDLISTQNSGEEVEIINTPSEYSQADFIISHIKNYVGGIDLLNAKDEKGSFRDFGILYRNHNLKNILLKKLKESGIPYQILGEESIYEELEIQKIISQLSSLIDKSDSLIETIKTFGEKLKIEESKIHELLSLVYRFENEKLPIKAFLDYVETISKREYFDPKLNAVVLLTMHSSKGLEFENVFLCGLNDDIIPGKNKDEEEEKRILYVALSRAKRKLIIMIPKKRLGKNLLPSRFLKNLNINFKNDHVAEKRMHLIQKRKLKKNQMELF